MFLAMTRAAKLLKLKEHKVGEHLIPFPFDIEGHRGTDNRLYVVDFARVFPPTVSHFFDAHFDRNLQKSGAKKEPICMN